MTGENVQIPQPLLSPITQNMLRYVPLPNDTASRYTVGIPVASGQQQWTAKADYNLRSHRLFVRFFSEHNSTDPVEVTNDIFRQWPQSRKNWDNLAAGDTWSSGGAKWISDFRFSNFRAVLDNFAPSSHAMLSATALGMKGLTVDPERPGLLAFASFGFGAQNNQTSFPRRGMSFSEDVTHIAGKHQISFGANYSRASLNQYNTTGRNPVMVFQGVNSGLLLGARLVNAANADLMLGMPLVYIQQDGFFQTPGSNLFGMYIEDKYRVSERLTLMGGLRWDPYFPYSQIGDRMTCFTPGQKSKVFVNAPVGLNFPGDPGCEAGGTDPKYSIVQPRTGFAYRVTQNGDLAVRGGWGLYSIQLPMQNFIAFNSYPWNRSYQYARPFMNMADIYGGMGTPNPFAGGFQGPEANPTADVVFPATPSSISTLTEDYRPGTVQQWSLSIQKGFGSRDSVEIAYVGTKGNDLTSTADLNLPVSRPDASAASIQARRPYAGFQQIRAMRSDSSSSYNGMDLTYRHKSSSLFLTSAFNWSKCLDDLSSITLTAAVAQHGNNPRLTRGLCDFDQNLTWRTTSFWRLPSLSQAQPAVKYILGDWSLSGLFILDAGMPFTVTSGVDNSFTGLNTDFADRVPDKPVWVDGKLNYAAFTVNAPGTYGNSGRNAYRANGFSTLDVGLMKTFNITERWKTMFRAEAFNLLNHPNYYRINTAYSASTPASFGAYLSAQDPRILQFSLRVLF